jgi:SAM-dependent methyltransferase
MRSDSSSKQTLSFLMRRFAEAGIQLHTRLGQNFLIDLNLQRVLLNAAELGSEDVVLEIGTGTGSLTALMARQAAAVITVEIDRRLFQLAGEELADLDNVTMLRLDALKNKNRLDPVVLETVARAGRADRGWARVQGLRGVEHLGAKSVPGGDCPRVAAGGVLAAAKSLFGHYPDYAGRRATAPDPGSGLFPQLRSSDVFPPSQIPSLTSTRCWPCARRFGQKQVIDAGTAWSYYKSCQPSAFSTQH